MHRSPQVNQSDCLDQEPSVLEGLQHLDPPLWNLECTTLGLDSLGLSF